MTRMTGPDCVVMCNLINTHNHMCPRNFLTSGLEFESRCRHTNWDISSQLVENDLIVSSQNSTSLGVVTRTGIFPRN